MSVSELAKPFKVSLPAVMKHLDVLSDAGPDPAHQDRPGGFLRAHGSAHGGRHAVVEPVCAVLVAATRSSCRLCGGRVMSLAQPDSRHQAKPHPQASSQCAGRKSLRRLDRPRKNREMVRSGFRTGDAGRDRSSRRRPLSPSRSTPRMASIIRSAASIARWCRTRSWSSPGPGTRRRSASRSSPSRSSRTATGSILTLLHEQFFDEAARDGHKRGWSGSLDKLEKLFA